MGRTLDELCQSMTSQEFALHLQLEIQRNNPRREPEEAPNFEDVAG